jgi:hypothetical protein
MSNLSPIHNQQKNLETRALTMLKNLSLSAHEYPIPPTSSTMTQAKNSSDTLCNTNTGVHSKWSVLAWKLRQHEILHGKSSDTEVSVSKNSVNDMLTRQKILSLLPAVEDFKTQRIDKTA